MTFHCTQESCNGQGVWRGCLPCPATMGGGLKDCLNRRPKAETEQYCQDWDMPYHAAHRPEGLRAVAQAAEDYVTESLVLNLVVEDPNTPEWVKKWLVGEVLPAVAAAVESLRVAAADRERNTRSKVGVADIVIGVSKPAETDSPERLRVLKGRSTANKFPGKS